MKLQRHSGFLISQERLQPRATRNAQIDFYLFNNLVSFALFAAIKNLPIKKFAAKAAPTGTVIRKNATGHNQV
jgi:hypothetical protein